MSLPVAEGATDNPVMLDVAHEVTAQTWIFERKPTTAQAAPIGLDITSEGEDTWEQVAQRAERLGAQRLAEREESGVR